MLKSVADCKECIDCIREILRLDCLYRYTSNEIVYAGLNHKLITKDEARVLFKFINGYNTDLWPVWVNQALAT